MFKDGLFGVAMDEDVLDRATGNGGDDDVVVDVVGIVVVDVVVVVVDVVEMGDKVDVVGNNKGVIPDVGVEILSIAFISTFAFFFFSSSNFSICSLII